MDSKIKHDIARLEGNIKIRRLQIRDWATRADDLNYEKRKLEQNAIIEKAQGELVRIEADHRDAPNLIRQSKIEIARKTKKLVVLRNAAAIEKLKKLALELETCTQEMDNENDNNST